MSKQNVYTLGDLKEFVNGLSKEQLELPAKISIDEDPYFKAITGHEISAKDSYVNKEDEEDGGELEELQDIHGDDFDINDYKIGLPKGSIFLCSYEWLMWTKKQISKLEKYMRSPEGKKAMEVAISKANSEAKTIADSMTMTPERWAEIKDKPFTI